MWLGDQYPLLTFQNMHDANHIPIHDFYAKGACIYVDHTKRLEFYAETHNDLDNLNLCLNHLCMCPPTPALEGGSCEPPNAAAIGKCAGFLNALCTELHATTGEPQWIADSPPADLNLNHLTFVCKSATTPNVVAMHDLVDSQWESVWYDEILQTVGADDFQLACEQATSHKYDASLQCAPEQSLKKMIAGICAHRGMISTYGDHPVTNIFDPTLITASNMCEQTPVAGASRLPHDDAGCVAQQDGTETGCAPPPCTVTRIFRAAAGRNCVR